MFTACGIMHRRCWLLVTRMRWNRCMVWIDDSRGQVAGSCEGGNEPLDPIKCGEFLD